MYSYVYIYIQIYNHQLALSNHTVIISTLVITIIISIGILNIISIVHNADEASCRLLMIRKGMFYAYDQYYELIIFKQSLTLAVSMITMTTIINIFARELCQMDTRKSRSHANPKKKQVVSKIITTAICFSNQCSEWYKKFVNRNMPDI